ncbi:MAG TPA: hypothetical protein ENN84_01230 [Candidatus Marinimicrobia bacterium]|nr:hypothetical protein [Candidatus Neomarinimicrobiota bacterium]
MGKLLMPESIKKRYMRVKKLGVLLLGILISSAALADNATVTAVGGEKRLLEQHQYFSERDSDGFGRLPKYRAG